MFALTWPERAGHILAYKVIRRGSLSLSSTHP